MNPFDRTRQEPHYYRLRQERERIQCVLQDINDMLKGSTPTEIDRLNHLLLRLLFDFTHWTAHKNTSEIKETSTHLEQEVISTIDRVAALLGKDTLGSIP